MKFLLPRAWMLLILALSLVTPTPAVAQTASQSSQSEVPQSLHAYGKLLPVGTNVLVNWHGVPQAQSYNVYRNGQLLNGVAHTYFFDYGAAAGETHTYTVTAVGAWGESAPSASVTARAPVGGGQVVYVDALQNGWQPWGWADLDYANTFPRMGGSHSVRVKAGPWQAMYLHHAPFDTTSYTVVSLWVHGGKTGGQRLSLTALRSGTPQASVTLDPLPARVWRQVTVPLSTLGVAGVSDMDGLWVQDASGTAQPAFYVDRICLGTAAASPTLIPAPQRLSVTPQWVTSCPSCPGMAMPNMVLSWAPVQGVPGYVVCRNGTPVAPSVTQTGWTDMTVVSDHTYAYTVAALGPAGPGTASAPVSATAPNPPSSSAALTAPVNLGVHGTWLAGQTDVLSWSPVPAAASYNVYQYGTLIAQNVTSTAYTVPSDVFSGGLTYAVTAVDGLGMETLPSAIAASQGQCDPAQDPTWTPAPPQAPTNVVATPEWNAGVPRIHLTWYGWDTSYTYNVYRDGVKVASGLWGLNYFDTTVAPGETHSYAVSGVNLPWNTSVEGPQSASVTATALAGAPNAAPGVVQITGLKPNDDGVLVSFAAVPGAVDYRAYSMAKPNVVKYSGGGLSIEMNGLNQAGATLVVEAVDKLGPFQTMDGMAGPGAMVMGSTHSAINGQGDPSDVPNVLAASVPFPVVLQPTVLAGSQVFFDNFRDENPLTLQPSPDITGNPDGSYDSYGQPNNYWEQANDKWRIRNYVGDTDYTKVFFMGNHFMDTLYDGGTARKGGPMHNNNSSLVMMPRATADISGGGVLHVTFEVDAHFDSRRWCDLVVAPAGDTLLNPGAKGGGHPTFSGTDTAFRWRIEYQNSIPEMVNLSATAPYVTVENALVPINGQAWDVARSSARVDPYQGTPQANGTLRDLDKRHRFDLYLSQTHFRIMEQGTVAWEGDIPAALAMPVGPYQVYFVHQLYHTGNDRPEQVDWNPENTYWYNDRPYSDERHWDNMGQSVLPDFPVLP